MAAVTGKSTPNSVGEIFKSMSYGPAPEAANVAQAWLDNHGRSLGHFINNRWVKPEGRKTYESKNPATGEKLTSTVQGTDEDVELAVSSAKKAFESWSTLPSHVRARYLYRSVVHFTFSHLNYQNNLNLCTSRTNSRFIYTDQLCVIGAIVPWNFPLMLLTWKVGPALAMGNTVVLKPATYTRLTALLFAEICAEAGLPPGVFNVVTGDGRFGSKLATHPSVDKVAFTGSTQ
ncbi:uncharacterized protein LOC102802098, partial [Saccoglossus kowalevskii]|uniref:Aldehyde dehydrogenase 5, mitochondrial-like n=1 Tax=Saccoglossus kowalevskii TaxID=10224 RepID=A0ABM0M7B2_SACKO